MTNTNKLKGRIYERGFNLSSLADAIPISRPTLRNKLNHLSDFRVGEIKKICSLLDISVSEVGTYFFD